MGAESKSTVDELDREIIVTIVYSVIEKTPSGTLINLVEIFDLLRERGFNIKEGGVIRQIVARILENCPGVKLTPKGYIYSGDRKYDDSDLVPDPDFSYLLNEQELIIHQPGMNVFSDFSSRLQPSVAKRHLRGRRVG